MDERKCIVFTQLKPSIWQYKVARAMRKKGIRTVLITLLNQFDRESYKKAFDEIITLDLNNLKTGSIIKRFFKNPFFVPGFFRRISSLNPKVVIAEGAPHYLAALFIRFFKNKCPRVYFPYDINLSRMKDLKSLVPKREVWGENYAFRNADAIFFKSDEKELELLPPRLIKDKPRLGVPHYTIKEWFDKKERKVRAEISIVYTGSFMDDAPIYISMVGDFNSILKQGLHLHLYIAHGKLNEHDKFRITEGNKELEKFLHVHSFVEPDKLSYEISKYHYGLYYARFSDLAIKEAIKFAAGNKIASYLEAGIPVIINYYNDTSRNIIDKEGIGISVKNIDNLKKEIEKVKYKKMIEKIVKFREKYSIEENIDPILGFLDKISKEYWKKR